jgi:RsiW-degrading membrane proteinase PrsW (M82 family)
MVENRSPQRLDYATPQRRSHSGLDLVFAWIRLLVFGFLGLIFLVVAIGMRRYDIQFHREGMGVFGLLIPAFFLWRSFKAAQDVRRRRH